jgi:hypothetical protein
LPRQRAFRQPFAPARTQQIAQRVPELRRVIVIRAQTYTPGRSSNRPRLPSTNRHRLVMRQIVTMLITRSGSARPEWTASAASLCVRRHVEIRHMK